MFQTILQASAQPMVQLNIPVKMLDPFLDKPQEKHETKGMEQILLNEKNTRLQKEPKNSSTRLLAAAVYYKLKRRFLNKGTQTEAVSKFNVNGKALGKILTGKRYLGGRDRKMVMKQKSQPAPTAVKAAKDTEKVPRKKRSRAFISSGSDED